MTLDDRTIARGVSQGIVRGVITLTGWGVLLGSGVAVIVARHFPPSSLSSMAIAGQHQQNLGNVDTTEKIPGHTENAVAGFDTTDGYLPCVKPDKSDCRTWDAPNGRPHNGVDVSTPTGTPLYPPGMAVSVDCSGNVTDTSGYGILAVIRPLSDEIDVYFKAGHLNSCTPGTYQPSEVFAWTGNSGYSTGPHLHWEEKGKTTDEFRNPAKVYLEATLTGETLTVSGGGDKFDKAMEFILDVEGECSDRPNDRGGWTCYGITEAVARRHGMTPADITPAIAKEIYYSDYWVGVCDDLPHPLSMACINTSVNSGAGKAQEFNALIDSKADPVEEAKKYLQRQRQHYANIIANDPTQAVFEEGWENRSKNLDRRLERLEH